MAIIGIDSFRGALYRQAETAKIALSGASAASISLQQGERQYSLMLTNDLLRRFCGPVFQKVRAVIARAMKDRSRGGRLNDVILVGGSAYSRRDDRTPHMAVLIPRSSMLPASHQERSYTLNDNQTGLRFEIYQGEGYFASENLKLGELEVRVPPGPAGEQSALVMFTYDIDGILHVSAQSSGGDFRERLILNPNLHLTEEGKVQAMERIRQIQLAAQGDRRDQLLLERALRLYTQTIGRRREALVGLIGYWKDLMDCGDRLQRRRDYDRVKEQLDLLEAAVEEDPQGFLKLRQAYQAALAWAEGTGEPQGFSPAGPSPEREAGGPLPEEDAPPEPVQAEEPGWSLQEREDGGPNPFEGGGAITKFLEFYTGKQRKDPKLWMDYLSSGAFLDAGWDGRFTALLLEKVTELEQGCPPNKEFLMWLSVAYQLTGETPSAARDLDGLDAVRQIAARVPPPSALMGRAKALYGPLRERVLEKIPGIDQKRLENFLLVNQKLKAHIARIKSDPAGEDEAAAFFASGEVQQALSSPRFIEKELARLRLTWTFKPSEGEPYQRHLVLLQDSGRFMLLWLQDDKKRADIYAADAPVRFLGHMFPACLVHRDLLRIRNCVDLLLDDIDNTEPVADRPGEFVPVALPYEALWAELVGDMLG